MAVKLSCVIKFVANMDRAVTFYRDVVGLTLKFQSPGWSEFATGDTTLALHPASEKNPAGAVEVGFDAPDVQKFYEEMVTKGVRSGSDSSRARAQRQRPPGRARAPGAGRRRQTDGPAGIITG
jgi:catechol 2,3-dioxygenase-like lactoylglutathione lyase family enzyme